MLELQNPEKAGVRAESMRILRVHCFRNVLQKLANICSKLTQNQRQHPSEYCQSRDQKQA